LGEGGHRELLRGDGSGLWACRVRAGWVCWEGRGRGVAGKLYRLRRTVLFPPRRCSGVRPPRPPPTRLGRTAPAPSRPRLACPPRRRRRCPAPSAASSPVVTPPAGLQRDASRGVGRRSHRLRTLGAACGGALSPQPPLAGAVSAPRPPSPAYVARRAGGDSFGRGPCIFCCAPLTAPPPGLGGLRPQ